MSTPLIEITRGAIVECIHRGDIAVVNRNGELLYSVGDPYRITYMRSAAKPIQAMNVLLSGAADRFGFSDKELAIICSSHYAEPMHLQVVEGILDKIGLNHADIRGGTVTSLNPEYALKLARDRVELNPAFSDCSGKHCGMLSVCQHRGYPVQSYLEESHPCQLEVKKIMSEICSVPEKDLIIGVDGCSAPVHGLPLLNMAMGFARLTNLQYLDKAYQSAAERISQVMIDNPQMIAGTGGFCTELIRNTHGKLIGKIGAEGVYCVGIRDQNIGIAIKIESGSMQVLPPVVVRVLDELGILNAGELGKLGRYRIMDNLNDVDTSVGEISPVFSL